MLERCQKKCGNLQTTIRGLGVLGVSLGVNQDEGAYTPLQFKLGASGGRLISWETHTYWCSSIVYI